MSKLTAYLQANGSLTYSNVGTSMLPLLRQGRDLLTLEPLPAGRCKVGDVVLFRRLGGQLVLHRIVRVLPDSYTLRGDNCTGDEPGVTQAQLLGVMTGFVRRGRPCSVDAPGYRLYTLCILRTAWLRIPLLRLLRHLKRRLRKCKRMK